MSGWFEWLEAAAVAAAAVAVGGGGGGDNALLVAGPTNCVSVRFREQKKEGRWNDNTWRRRS